MTVCKNCERLEKLLRKWKQADHCECKEPGDNYDDCHFHGGGNRTLYKAYPTTPYTVRSALERAELEVQRLQKEVA